MSYYSVYEKSKEAQQRAKAVKIVLSDNDGVLTDACVFYSQKGEELKRYNMRDGMGFDRLRKLAALPCGIITKERTDFSIRRSEKLSLEFIRVGIDDKVTTIEQILAEQGFDWEDLAYIGDDVNDLPVLKKAGLRDAREMPCRRSAMNVIFKLMPLADRGHLEPLLSSS